MGLCYLGSYNNAGLGPFVLFLSSTQKLLNTFSLCSVLRFSSSSHSKTLAVYPLRSRLRYSCLTFGLPAMASAAASEHTVLQFAAPSTAATTSTSLTAKVHPLVIFNICDCYVRRPDQAERVIGTLLGSVLTDGTIDIRNSYAVPHNESSDQVLLCSFFNTHFSCLQLEHCGKFCL